MFDTPSNPFSPAGRIASLEAMARDGVDVLVIGGGITGAGIARDASLRGWQVGLVEMQDFGAGTSSRSSKIIHGGVRYLEYGQFLLVRESARERMVLQEIAPHLVHRLGFLYPVFAPDSLTKIRAGLSVFDWLAGAAGEDKHENLKPEAVRERLPGLREPLKGAVLYPEYITDDARLTLENAQSAAENGAYVANHARVTGFLRGDGGAVVGVVVRDLLSEREHEVSAGCVVNAAGPWAEAVLSEAELPVEKPLRPSKGIHLLFSAERLPVEGATFLKSSTGRRGLAMRRMDYVYVGTSDTEYDGPLESPRATRADVEDLLAMVQDCFPEHELTTDDVLATWAGVRPLIEEEGKSTRDTSREDEVWSGPHGLVTIAGGKLTTYRRMAGRVIDEVKDVLDVPPIDRDRTREVPLPGTPDGDAATYVASRSDALRAAGVDEGTVERLAWLYGTQLDAIASLGEEDAAWLDPLGPGVPALRGEAKLAVEAEMAMTLIDFMDRRAALLLFSPGFGLAGAEEACAIMGEMLGWDEQRRADELTRYREYATEHGVPAQ